MNRAFALSVSFVLISGLATYVTGDVEITDFS